MLGFIIGLPWIPCLGFCFVSGLWCRGCLVYALFYNFIVCAFVLAFIVNTLFCDMLELIWLSLLPGLGFGFVSCLWCRWCPVYVVFYIWFVSSFISCVPSFLPYLLRFLRLPLFLVSAIADALSYPSPIFLFLCSASIYAITCFTLHLFLYLSLSSARIWVSFFVNFRTKDNFVFTCILMAFMLGKWVLCQLSLCVNYYLIYSNVKSVNDFFQANVSNSQWKPVFCE